MEARSFESVWELCSCGGAPVLSLWCLRFIMSSQEDWWEDGTMLPMTTPLSSSNPLQVAPPPSDGRSSLSSYWELHSQCRGCHVADAYDAG